jgi:DNA-binding CsgD family transcriptional regulator
MDPRRADRHHQRATRTHHWLDVSVHVGRRREHHEPRNGNDGDGRMTSMNMSTDFAGPSYPAGVDPSLLNTEGSTELAAARRQWFAEREIVVLRMIASGMETAEIAAELGISERTVKNVVHAITTRMQVRNRAHAVACAVRTGLI